MSEAEIAALKDEIAHLKKKSDKHYKYRKEYRDQSITKTRMVLKTMLSFPSPDDLIEEFIETTMKDEDLMEHVYQIALENEPSYMRANRDIVNSSIADSRSEIINTESAKQTIAFYISNQEAVSAYYRAYNRFFRSDQAATASNYGPRNSHVWSHKMLELMLKYDDNPEFSGVCMTECSTLLSECRKWLTDLVLDFCIKRGKAFSPFDW